ITKENPMFEKYYKALGIVPESEWEQFITALRQELPSTFRITGSRSHANMLLQVLKHNYLDQLKEATAHLDEQVDPPTSLPWYPDELAWKVNLSRKFIRKSPSIKKFHQFLVQETECGNISRQEAVSMIPPLLMDIKPGQKILDTCAAPGSKTSQIIEMLHGDKETGIAEGLVIANELQNKRCYMLIHQSKRLRSPSCVITNHDASTYPTLHVKKENGDRTPLLFDRILCDVPCSGDGTMRKNPLIWNKWTPQLGVSLHRTQLRILARAMEMLEVGGRIVYSTCTMSPIENESVVAEMLRNSDGALELVDLSNELPNLKRSPGLHSWKLMMKDGSEVTGCDPGSPAFLGGFRPSMLPPPDNEAKAMHLECCIRVYPHQQDTGGFFIAALVKTKQAPWEIRRCNSIAKWLPWQPPPENKVDADTSDMQDDTMTNEDDSGVDDFNKETYDVNDVFAKTESENTSSEPPCKKPRTNLGFKEDPFILLPDDDPHWPIIRDYFGFVPSFPSAQLLIRSIGGKKRNVYLVSRNVQALLECAGGDNDDVKLISAGVKTLTRCDGEELGCEFRLMQEGIENVVPYVTKRKVFITQEDVFTLVRHDKPFSNKFSQSTRDQLSKVSGLGCVIFLYDPESHSPSDTIKCNLCFCGWKARTSIRALMSRSDKMHYATLFNL
ncbi:predicted protein, partial [Nematostella vectensis]